MAGGDRISVSMSDGVAWMDGAFVPIAEAKISVLDWGFVRSDVVYDVVSVWDGAFFRLDDHLERFFASMNALHFSIPQSKTDVARILEGCVARSGLRESYVAMVCARGRVTVPGSRDPRDCANHFFAYAIPFIWVPKADDPAGLSVKIATETRRIPVDSVDPTLKNYMWGDFTRGLFEAKEAGFDTVALLDHGGGVTEGPGFNVFCVIGDRIVTPKIGHLMGVTRRTVIEMAREAGYVVEERALPYEELMGADEAFLSTSGGGVRPVTRVDDRIFSNGAPGPVAARLTEIYWRWRREGRLTTLIDYSVAPPEA